MFAQGSADHFTVSSVVDSIHEFSPVETAGVARLFNLFRDLLEISLVSHFEQLRACGQERSLRISRYGFIFHAI